MRVQIPDPLIDNIDDQAFDIVGQAFGEFL